MRLSQFITRNIEPIMAAWETFARTLMPTETMTVLAIRDHAPQILLAIAKDMESPQSETMRQEKSQGQAPARAQETSAATHGELRQLGGFDLKQVSAEYRALRASVLRLWLQEVGASGATALEEVNRFNEGIDQALAESISAYSHQMDKSRDTFLAILGHDLRSPLGALRTCLHALGKAEGTTTQNAWAVQIGKRCVTSIDEMITDLLEYTRSRLGKGIKVVREPADLSAVCQEAFDEVRAAHPLRTFIATIPAGLTASFDAPRLRQVLTNLLNNAVQHGSRSTAVRFELQADTHEVRLAVTNHGPAIPPEALQVIFEPLVQGPAPETDLHQRPASSLGLGLYIAREIVAGHGGAITVTSSVSDGTVFEVRFPRHAEG
jgi:signal transduction histidine kinase